jgi:hypothetical protein
MAALLRAMGTEQSTVQAEHKRSQQPFGVTTVKPGIDLSSEPATRNC